MQMPGWAWMLAYPADYIIVVGEMGLACFAAVDLGRVEVDVVRQAHVVYSAATVSQTSRVSRASWRSP